MEVDGRGRTISTAILYDVWNAMRGLEAGGELSVIADALPAVDSDIRAWCRTTGHEPAGVEENERERRYRIRRTDRPRPQPPWALVISDPASRSCFPRSATSAGPRWSTSRYAGRICSYPTSGSQPYPTFVEEMDAAGVQIFLQ